MLTCSNCGERGEWKITMHVQDVDYIFCTPECFEKYYDYKVQPYIVKWDEVDLGPRP